MLSAPPDVPLITGYNNGSTVSVHVGTAITLVCRADHGDPPYRLTWTNGTDEIHDGTRFGLYVKTNGELWKNSFGVYLTILYTIPYTVLNKLLQYVNTFKMLQIRIVFYDF